MKSIIQKLVETTGPSGYETLIREVIQKEIRPEKGQVDALGNLIVRKGEKLAGGYRIMLAAHMDEIGLIVTKVDRGFLHVGRIGGVDPRLILGQPVTLYPSGRSALDYPDGLPGYIGARSRGLCRLTVSQSSPSFADIGRSMYPSRRSRPASP